MGVGSSHEAVAAASCSSSSLTNLRSLRDQHCKDYPPHRGHASSLMADDSSAAMSATGVMNTSREKKKQRLPNFNSFKKRLGGKHKKTPTAADHSKQFYEYFSAKPLSVVVSLLEHYEILLVLRDLKIQVRL